MSHLSHWQADIIYWFVFFAGEMLFLIKRAYLAQRSPLNGVNSTWHYFQLNWQVILYRLGCLFVFPFWPYTHQDTLDSIIYSVVHLHLPFQIPKLLALTFAGGLVADYLLDWAAMQDKIWIIPVPKFLKEQIPQLPEVQQLVSTLAKTP